MKPNDRPSRSRARSRAARVAAHRARPLATLLVAFGTVASGTAALAAEGGDAVDGSRFRALEEGSWYHPVEPEMWAYFGADDARVFEVLERVEGATGERTDPELPDTVAAPGPGHWITEFVAAGDEAMARAAEAGDEETRLETFEEAMAYYHTAAAPHTNDPASVAAGEKAGEAYAAAAALLPGDFREVEIEHEGKTFGAYLHLPPGDGPHPVLVFSNGSDMAKETALGYYRAHLRPKGIGFLAIDTPGLGDSRAFDVVDGRTEKLHVAAIEWAKGQPEIDADNVFMQGVSFGGNAAARVFLAHPELDLAGVVYTCGPIHQAFMAPPEAYEDFPAFTMDGVKTRLGLETDAPMTALAERIRALSLERAGLLDGEPVRTPLLAINTNDDPVAPLEDMDRLLARAEDGRRIVFDLPGHCPPHDTREAIVSAWILQRLR